MDYNLAFKIIIDLFFLYLAIPTIIGFNNGAGPLFTPKKNLKTALGFIGMKPGQKFFELGTGTGRMMIIAAKNFNADVYGIEISPPLFFITFVNLYLNSVKKFKLYRKNFYYQNISAADVVYCFISEKDLEIIKGKFLTELSPDSWVISYGFPIEGWKITKIFDFDNPGKMYLYKMKLI